MKQRNEIKLTDEQIESLYKFCNRHFVYFYDVQVELVDHLANAIEEAMATNPGLTFEKALDKVYSGFGVMGFAPIVKEKHIQLSKKTRIDFLKLFLREFRWPAILRFLGIGSLVYFLATLNLKAGYYAALVLIFLGTAKEIYDLSRYHKLIKRTGKKFMLTQYFFPTGIFWLYITTYLFLVPDIFTIPDVESKSTLFLAILTGISVVSIQASNHLSKLIKQKVEGDYPEVFQMAG